MASRLLSAPEPFPQEPELEERLRSLYGEASGLFPARDFRQAAVLIALAGAKEEGSVILTQRASHLGEHAGQVSFPGGRIDAGETVLEAALREAEEEIGLQRSFVQPLGYLPGYATLTSRYWIAPVVAALAPGFTLSPGRAEVAEILEIPLAQALSPGALGTEKLSAMGKSVEIRVLRFGRHRIWGATAAMLASLGDLASP